ncbi:MAG: DUF1080 domain-containing protein [Verrucomicrobia bacterium]|nr:DUF1080 domain-containing protein [Verrucomicrobiota bacterium]
MNCRILSVRCSLAVSLLLLGQGSTAHAADNKLTPSEKAAGWTLLFDGKTTDGWLDSKEQPVAATHVNDGTLNPHPCNYMLIHKEVYDNFKLSLDFKVSPKCNSGVFIRTFPLKPREGKDVGFNGIEVAIDDTTTAGFHDTGALYDLVQPSKNAMNPQGEWNHMQITCDKSLIIIEVNGIEVTRTDLEQWTMVNKRPDGTDHKFDVIYKDHPRKGYIGLQDHGSDVWYRNIKLLRLKNLE